MEWNKRKKDVPERSNQSLINMRRRERERESRSCCQAFLFAETKLHRFPIEAQFSATPAFQLKNICPPAAKHRYFKFAQIASLASEWHCHALSPSLSLSLPLPWGPQLSFTLSRVALTPFYLCWISPTKILEPVTDNISKKAVSEMLFQPEIFLINILPGSSWSAHFRAIKFFLIEKTQWNIMKGSSHSPCGCLRLMWPP